MCFADVDECQMRIDECDDGCENTNGSFVCTCPSFGIGFKINGTECAGIS